MSTKSKILVVDDEISIIEVLKALLKREGYSVKTASNAHEALETLKKTRIDLMISDIRMAPIDGLELLSRAREIQSHMAIIMMTAYAAVETAVEAMQKGAFDYICKPFKVDELLLTVQRALSYEHVLVENENLKETLRTKYHFKNLVGDSKKMQEIYSIIDKVSATDTTVLLLGESGTGKELVAKALHCGSPRAETPFLGINCAALPDTLLESELFGYVKGAFTGANKFKKGFFESADGGTLFLDEVGSIPMPMQLSLLRVLQEQEIRPVGSTENIPVDVRIIAATNENLEERIASGQFREDLYYRLSVIPIEMPPLRERMSDIPLLVKHFLREIQEEEDKPEPFTLSGAALDTIKHYSWPGNVRELRNVIRRAATLCDPDKPISVEDLPKKLVRDAKNDGSSFPKKSEGEFSSFSGMSLKAYLRKKERAYISHVLGKCDGDKEEAARTLGISLATLYRKYSTG